MFWAAVFGAVVVVVAEVPLLAEFDAMPAAPTVGLSCFNLRLELGSEFLVLVVVAAAGGAALGWHQNLAYSQALASRSCCSYAVMRRRSRGLSLLTGPHALVAGW